MAAIKLDFPVPGGTTNILISMPFQLFYSASFFWQIDPSHLSSPAWALNPLPVFQKLMDGWFPWPTVWIELQHLVFFYEGFWSIYHKWQVRAQYLFHVFLRKTELYWSWFIIYGFIGLLLGINHFPFDLNSFKYVNSLFTFTNGNWKVFTFWSLENLKLLNWWRDFCVQEDFTSLVHLIDCVPTILMKDV